MKWKRECISEKKMEVFGYVVRKSAQRKEISYGPEGGVKERICTEQLMPLILKTE